MNVGLQVGLTKPPASRIVRRSSVADRRLQGPTQPPTAVIPPGHLMPSASTKVPAGWLLCDGSAVDRYQYAALFDAIGIQYGAGDGYRTFNVPNLKGKVVVGVDTGQTEFATLGQTGGSKTSTAPHTHDLASHTHDLASHTHTLSSHTHTMGNHNHGNTGTESVWHDHAINHYHTGNIGNHLWSGNGVHNCHCNHAGFTGEAPDPYSGWAAAPPLNIDGTARGAPNGDNWSGNQNVLHVHGTGGPSTNTSDGPSNNTSGTPSNNISGAPSSNTSGASSAAAISGNLQPYLTLPYLIKT